MTLTELIARFRREESDTALPYGWSDATITDLLNEAENEACRRALLLVDSTTTAIAKVAFIANAIGIALPEQVIYVRRAVLASNGKKLIHKVSADMDDSMPGWESDAASEVQAFIPDWQTQYLRFWPPSASADTLNMTVVRTPKTAMDTGTDTPEIPARYHADLLDWVRFRCYSDQDADRYDPAKSEKAEAKFIANFGKTSAIDEHWSVEQYYDIGAY